MLKAGVIGSEKFMQKYLDWAGGAPGAKPAGGCSLGADASSSSFPAQIIDAFLSQLSCDVLILEGGGKQVAGYAHAAAGRGVYVLLKHLRAADASALVKMARANPEADSRIMVGHPLMFLDGFAGLINAVKTFKGDAKVHMFFPPACDDSPRELYEKILPCFYLARRLARGRQRELQLVSGRETSWEFFRDEMLFKIEPGQSKPGNSTNEYSIRIEDRIEGGAGSVNWSFRPGLEIFESGDSGPEKREITDLEKIEFDYFLEFARQGVVTPETGASAAVSMISAWRAVKMAFETKSGEKDE